MSNRYSFHGGVHPPQNKQQSIRIGIETAPLPQRLIIPLSQHIGVPAKAIVQQGDLVLKGQLIAEAVGRISVNVHAPSSGRVEAITLHTVPHSSGLSAPCIIIQTDGKDEWIEHKGIEDYRSMNKRDLVEYIRYYGISGMGGAGFPTDVKLNLGDDKIVNTLIINAMECEPYITADDMLMREFADKVIKGIEIIACILQPSAIMIGIEDNKPQAIQALRKATEESELQIKIVVKPTIYPSGGEKQLIKLLTNIEVPSGGIPADIGIVCQNVGTAAAIYDAVYLGEPLISRIVTLTGDASGKPHNAKVLLGTPIVELLQTAMVNETSLYRLVVGGPMMGFTLKDTSVPIIKTTNCIIAATYEEMPAIPPANECIRCGICEQVCPVELLPQQLYWYSKSKEFDKAKHHNLFDCIECGACSYVCSSNIPLVQYYRFAKASIKEEEIEQRKSEHAKQRFEARKARFEQEKAEKAALRKQRAEAAAAAKAKKETEISAEKPEASVVEQASNEPDLKALKMAAAIARTQLKKSEKALQDAKNKGIEGLDDLEKTVANLVEKSEKAKQELEQAMFNQPTKNEAVVAVTSTIEPKASQQEITTIKAKLNTAQTLLDKATEKGEDIAQLQKNVEHLTKQYNDASKTAAINKENQPDKTTNDGADLKQLKIDAAMARTAVTKAERRLAKAQESGESLEQLEQELAVAQAKATKLNQILDKS